MSILGPKILNGRTFDVKKGILAYNAINVVINIYVAAILWGNTIGYYNWTCEPVDFSTSARAMAIATGVWWSYMTKIMDMLDTVFFLLRGKYNHMSFLQLYHHSTMVLIMWIAANFVPGGNVVWGAALNASVHIIMYSYYFVSALGPRFQKYLGWKKTLTMIQERS